MDKINDQQSHILQKTKYPFVVALSIRTIYDWMTGGMSFKGVHLSLFYFPDQGQLIFYRNHQFFIISLFHRPTYID
jgi:hypothetical protein